MPGISSEVDLAGAALCTVIAQQVQANKATIVADAAALVAKGADAIDAAGKTVVDNATPGPLKFLDGEFNAFIDSLDATAKADAPTVLGKGVDYATQFLTNEAATLTKAAGA